ncbi:hypothetical protein PGB27_19985 [Actinomycetospora sp. DW7H6]|uniref:Uncharacterized protein n=1 Tax=Actinomycetospora lemnae TaxID=3019891 RepID=A0ABT5SXP6_9PSEU|nr:hypothetical protein [Actinomycetospora sp. DW7H6]MDD7967627.1 hypothetical protein [Actinomycetospora sp. DW7H6]
MTIPAAAVHVGQGVGQRRPERDDVDDRQRTGADALRERVALDELHDEVGAAVLVADVVDGDEPRVRQAGEREHLAAVAGLLALLDVADLLGGVGGIARLGVRGRDGARRVEHLDGHVAAEELVAGPENVGGTATPDEVAERVAPADHRGRTGVGAHCPPPSRCALAPIIPYDRVPRLRDVAGGASPERRVAPGGRGDRATAARRCRDHGAPSGGARPPVGGSVRSVSALPDRGAGHPGPRRSRTDGRSPGCTTTSERVARVRAT